MEKGEDWVYARRVAGHADGFVPSSFLVKTGTKEEEALLNAEGGAASNTTVPEHGTLDLVAARLEAGEVRATSVGDFSAGGDSEMTLAFRESVLVSSDDFASGPDDWVYARRLKTKEDGFVPRSFLVLAGSEEEKDFIENDDGCPVVIPSGELEEGDVRATAVGAFAPDGESEMSLTFGEPLIVRKAELEGGEDWIYAKRLKGREDGFVPRAFLVETGTSAERDALAAGDANGGEETAAVALQAAIRGKAARTKAAMPTRPAPHASAVKLQARLRGRSARKLVAPKRKAPLTKAATKLQARQRGRSATPGGNRFVSLRRVPRTIRVVSVVVADGTRRRRHSRPRYDASHGRSASRPRRRRDQAHLQAGPGSRAGPRGASSRQKSRNAPRPTRSRRRSSRRRSGADPRGRSPPAERRRRRRTRRPRRRTRRRRRRQRRPRRCAWPSATLTARTRTRCR